MTTGEVISLAVTALNTVILTFGMFILTTEYALHPARETEEADRDLPQPTERL